jgi:glycosyltransferase involved in cell wall biosynthesis
MKKILFVKNIIPPYRIALFNDLNEIGQNYPIDFEVFVMSESEDGRFWKLNLNDIKFDFTYDGQKGFYKFLLKKYHFHFNPNLIKLIRRQKYDTIILGSSWNDFNILMIVFLKRMGFINSKIAFWSEANYLTLGAVNDNKIKFSIRKFILNTCDSFFLIPGQMASITLFEKWKLDKKRTIFFPNLINSFIFKIDDLSLQERKYNNTPVFLIVARLNEDLKGIRNFISNLPLEKDFIIRIAGDGEDRKMYEDYIENNNLSSIVFLLGNLNEDQLLKEYKKANVFVLPSFSDPSPLSIVEASYMKLPLLLSDRCGNHFETIKDDFNGYLFNPNDFNDIKLKFIKMLDKGYDGMEKMGQNSYQTIISTYDTKSILKNFIEKII